MNAGQAKPRRASLAVWMTAGVAMFVLLGSLALVVVLQRQGDREERRAFEELARANAGFLERTRLPMSGKMAGQLGEVIGARVYFRAAGSGVVAGRPGDAATPAEAMAKEFDGKVHRLPGGEWMVGVVARDGSRILFVKPGPPRLLALGRAETWGVLGGFWLLSLALGMGLARRVTRPLRALAETLPLVGTDRGLPGPPLTRGDEIGQLDATLRRTHESLREERERRRAAERHAVLGRMAGHLAHEVRNPVAAIRLHAQLLENAGPDEAAVSRGLIEAEAGRIEELVGQWLSYARPAPPVWTATDVVAVAREAVTGMAARARHAGVDIRFAARGPVVIAADGRRLRQVLVNLLLNAVQAMPRGGTATVSIADEGSMVAVVVEDEGTGFSPPALRRAGEAFFSEKEGGMGLGLAVAREICEAHGGQLRVANRPGGGASVRCEFAKDGRAAQPAEAGQTGEANA